MTHIIPDPITNTYRAAIGTIRPALAGVAGFSAILNVLMLTGSVYMLQVYDRVLGSGSLATLAGLFTIVVILFSFLGLYDGLRGRLLSRAALRLDQNLATPAFSAHLHAGRGGDEQPLRDLDNVRGFVGSPAMGGLFDLPFVPLFLIILTLIHPWLGGITLIGAGVVAALAVWTRQVTGKTEATQMGHEQAARRLAQLGQNSADTMIAMGMESRISARWDQLRQTGLAAAQRSGDPASNLAAASRSIRMLLQSTILTVGAVLTLRGEISAGMIIAASVLSGRALAPVDQAIGQWRMIGRALAAHHRLDAFFAKPPATRDRTSLPAPTGAITLKKVSKLAVAQPGVDRAQILSQIDLELEAGDGLGVLGHSASGKSTLARLLVGAERPDLGELRFDGATPDQWASDDLGRHIGYLPQTPTLLPGTLRENIARFDPDAKDSDVIAAAELTGTHEMILQMPQGYDTPVGGAQNSTPLSGGQLQRIGLTRAIFGTPAIVVLDEPNAHLDTAGEGALTKTIMALRDAGSTVIVMAHRPSALAAVNKILVLRHGKVDRFGPKEDFVTKPAAVKTDASTAPDLVKNPAKTTTDPSGPRPRKSA